MCIVGVALRPDGTKVPVMSWSEWLLKPLYRNDMPSNGSPKAGEWLEGMGYASARAGQRPAVRIVRRMCRSRIFRI